MKRNLKIFIACAKELKDQRDKIKALANDLNVEYRPLGTNIDIRSYENFGDQQVIYNHFIEHEAHIVILILDGRIGIRTEEELILASKSLHKHGHPEIMVFVRKENAKDTDIAHIEGLMRGALDRYYVEYTDNTQLITAVKDRLRKYISRPQKNRTAIIKDTVRRNRLWILSTALLLTILATACLYFLNRHKAPLLVFGGGSTAQFIETRLGCEMSALGDVYYVRMPSKNAWSIIKDELAHTTRSDKYTPICISAAQAAETDFSSAGLKDKKRPATVVSVPLGHDILTVYLRNVPELTSSLSHLSDHNPHITTSELYTLLTKHNTSINLFTTSSESGTFDKYSRSLCQIDSTISLKDLSSGQFFDNTDLVTINDNGRPYILLGAGDYKVESLNDDISSGKCLLLPLIDNSGQTITKPHFMYLIAYPTEKEDERQIAQNVAEFLKRLNLDTHKKIRDTRIRVRDTRVLIPLDSLEEWH